MRTSPDPIPRHLLSIVSQILADHGFTLVTAPAGLIGQAVAQAQKAAQPQPT